MDPGQLPSRVVVGSGAGAVEREWRKTGNSRHEFSADSPRELPVAIRSSVELKPGEAVTVLRSPRAAVPGHGLEPPGPSVPGQGIPHGLPAGPKGTPPGQGGTASPER